MLITNNYHIITKFHSYQYKASHLVTKLSIPIKYPCINQRFVNKVPVLKSLKDKLLPFKSFNTIINLRNYFNLLKNKLSPSIAKPLIQNNVFKTILNTNVNNN